MRIVVNTPAGNIGRVVTERLLRAKDEVIVMSRNPDKVTRFVEDGALLIRGSIDDADVLDQAFNGADALFWLTPFAFDQPRYIDWAKRTARTAANAVARRGVRRVVLISSVGAQHESGVGPIACLPAIESAFNDAAPDVTCLRAGSFMENFLNDVASIASAGSIFGPHPATMKFPRVATRDIADRAVEILRAPSGTGHRIVGVHGPEDLDQTQAAQIISEGIQRPVKYVEVTIDQSKQNMAQAGLPEFAAELLGDMYAGFRAGRMVPVERRTAETTTRTSLLQFSRDVLKPAVDLAAMSLDR
jgi:uncharacterized protein YbjT (DUF2867 family)